MLGKFKSHTVYIDGFKNINKGDFSEPSEQRETGLFQNKSQIMSTAQKEE